MIVNNTQDLGALLKEGRVAKGWTQAELAHALGGSRQWVISAEAGAPTAQVGLYLTALRLVDLMVDVVRDDESQALIEAVFGGSS